MKFVSTVTKDNKTHVVGVFDTEDEAWNTPRWHQWDLAVWVGDVHKIDN